MDSGLRGEFNDKGLALDYLATREAVERVVGALEMLKTEFARVGSDEVDRICKAIFASERVLISPNSELVMPVYRGVDDVIEELRVMLL